MFIKPIFIYRPSKSGLSGFYLGLYPHIGFNSYISSYDPFKAGFIYGFGFITGYKWIFKNGFTLQLGTGISKIFCTAEDDMDLFITYRFHSDGSLTLPAFTLQIIDLKFGYSFKWRRIL